MIKKFHPLILVLFLWSCGAGSNESSVITPTDTISSAVKVRFNSKTVTVLEEGQDPQSEVFEACNFSMAPIEGDLHYALVNQDTLELGTGRFSFKRTLKTPKTKAGVADRIFSVWGIPDVTSDGVTLSLEVEVEPELLTFRMNCTG